MFILLINNDTESTLILIAMYYRAARFIPETLTICSQSAPHVRHRKPARLQTIDPCAILTIYGSLISIYYAIDAIRHVNRGIIGAQDGRLRPHEVELAKGNRTRRHIRSEPNY